MGGGNGQHSGGRRVEAGDGTGKRQRTVIHAQGEVHRRVAWTAAHGAVEAERDIGAGVLSGAYEHGGKPGKTAVPGAERQIVLGLRIQRCDLALDL